MSGYSNSDYSIGGQKRLMERPEINDNQMEIDFRRQPCPHCGESTPIKDLKLSIWGLCKSCENDLLGIQG